MTTDLFCLSGEPIQEEPLEYKACGLDNIYLVNGYKIHHRDGDEFVAVTDVDGLYKAIGRHLVMHRKGLAPKEIRFLRKAMDMTQSELAKKLGNDAQSVARWEKGVCEMPGTAEKLLRVTFLAENIRAPGDLELLRKLLVSVMDDLDAIDEAGPIQAQFEFDEGWDQTDELLAA